MKDFNTAFGKWLGITSGVGVVLLLLAVLYAALVMNSPLAIVIVTVLGFMCVLAFMSWFILRIQRSDNDIVITQQSKQIADMGRNLTRLSQSNQQMLSLPGLEQQPAQTDADYFEVINPDDVTY